MKVVTLSPIDLALASLLVIVLAVLSRRLGLGLERRLLIAAARTTVQLLLIGYVLRMLFAHVNLAWVALLSFVMVAIAGKEVVSRQQYRLTGWRGYGVGAGSMFVSSFAVAVAGLMTLIEAEPWYAPQYSIPLLGMLLGNSMNGVALASGRLTQSAWEKKALIEQRLALGQTRDEATLEIRRDCLRTGMVPIINSMTAAGVVSLPGMMTGQILAGSPPVEAVKYQILIMFLICASTGFGTLLAIRLTTRQLFDHRQRLRLDALKAEE